MTRKLNESEKRLVVSALERAAEETRATQLRALDTSKATFSDMVGYQDTLAGLAQQQDRLATELQTSDIVRHRARGAVMTKLLLPMAKMPEVLRESLRSVLKAHDFGVGFATGETTRGRRELLEITEDRFERLLDEAGRNATQALFSIDETPQDDDDSTGLAAGDASAPPPGVDGATAPAPSSSLDFEADLLDSVDSDAPRLR